MPKLQPTLAPIPMSIYLFLQQIKLLTLITSVLLKVSPRPNDHKLDKITSLPTLFSLTHVRSVFGSFDYYVRFFPDYSEKRYAVVHAEGLAVEKYRHFLLGSRFLLCCNSSAVVYIISPSKPSAKLSRQFSILIE
ncbi:hypothetical protein K501DRAFT_271575 [Backusella circina FSU 941]|nr:hypothetical protein K501DRAFT_271575 [Backusella circina FSU 941]